MKPPKFQISCQKIRETTQKKKSIKQEPKKKLGEELEKPLMNLLLNFNEHAKIKTAPTKAPQMDRIHPDPTPS